MSSRRDKKEVSVEPPQFTHIEEPKIIKDTVEAERLRFFAVTKRVGESISGLMVTVGTLSLLVSLQYLLNPLLSFPGLPSVRDLLTPELVTILMGIVGVINIICGFVMLAKE